MPRAGGLEGDNGPAAPVKADFCQHPLSSLTGPQSSLLTQAGLLFTPLLPKLRLRRLWWHHENLSKGRCGAVDSLRERADNLQHRVVRSSLLLARTPRKWKSITSQMAMTNTRQDSKALLRAVNVTLTYKDGQNSIYAVRDVNLAVAAGEFVGILGPSGSGKTSLLYVLSGIRPAGAGQVYFNGQDIDTDVVSREELRRRNFGFVFQQYFLINYLSVLQNIVVGALRDDAQSRERARELVAELGMAGLEDRKPYELSAGQRQRVAIGRAMINSPRVVFADEPTANLDPSTGANVMEVLTSMRERSSLIVVSHDEEILGHAEARYRMRDGRLERVGCPG